MDYIQQGTPAFRRVIIALFLGSCVTFATLYSLQPLLPTLSNQFHIGPAMASLSLSVSTIMLALFLLIAAAVSDAFGRKLLMTVSLIGTAVLALLIAWSPNLYTLLLLRAFQGIMLAGVPAIAMAYLSEEMAPQSLGMAMGIYISGNAIGGMGGRLLTGMIASAFSWHIALTVIGLVGILIGIWFWKNLPVSKNFRPHTITWREELGALAHHLKDPGLLCLYGIAFSLMGSFVALYNYLGYQLEAAPYHLSTAVVSWIFLVYLVGAFSSTWMGRLADRLGRRKVLWVGIVLMMVGAVITLHMNLIVKIAGVSIFTFGFFGAHSIAGSWVGKRVLKDKAQASSLYLLFFYVGSSIGGFVGGLFWSNNGWQGVVAMMIAFLLFAFVLSVRLSSIPPAVAPQKILATS